jgi:hypothetical protein
VFFLSSFLFISSIFVSGRCALLVLYMFQLYLAGVLFSRPNIYIIYIYMYCISSGKSGHFILSFVNVILKSLLLVNFSFYAKVNKVTMFTILQAQYVITAMLTIR